MDKKQAIAIVFMIPSSTAVTELRSNLVAAALFALTAIVVVAATGTKRLIRTPVDG